MKLLKNTKWTRFALLFTGLFASIATSGCAPFAGFQSTVGGQTLPSAYYLSDDVQFFPAGQEDLIPNQRQAIEEYNLSRVAANNNFER